MEKLSKAKIVYNKLLAARSIRRPTSGAIATGDPKFYATIEKTIAKLRARKALKV